VSALAEVAIRPGGRLYRSRSKARAHSYGDDGGASFGVVVTRTHDVDLAVPLAAQTWRWMFDSNVPLPAARIGWTRLVPWDLSGYGDWSWDSCTGVEANSLPCVWFDGDDYGREWRAH